MVTEFDAAHNLVIVAARAPVVGTLAVLAPNAPFSHSCCNRIALELPEALFTDCRALVLLGVHHSSTCLVAATLGLYLFFAVWFLPACRCSSRPRCRSR